MPVRDLIGAEVKVLFSGKVTIASATTTTIGADLNLASSSVNYKPGDRIVAIFDNSTTGTTDTTSWVVQDAPDNSGSIGTPATAVTSGSLAGGTGDRYASIGVRIQAGRPWLRFAGTRASGATDSTVVQVTVLAVPRVL